MLDPYFFRCPPELNLNLKSPRLRFQITRYSKEGDFTLLGWQFGDRQEYVTGELLYEKKNLILYGGGSINLPGDISVDTEAPNPWDRLTTQDIFISPATAAILRKNYFFLKNKDKI